MTTTTSPTPIDDLVKIQSSYTLGQTQEMISLLSKRSAKNSAAFLLPHIKSTDKMLDVGCGPGNITRDFAKLVPQGSVTGIDASKVAIDIAVNDAKEARVVNATFLLADAKRLPLPDNTFDVVYSHQVLVHAPNPIDIIKEIYRVLKPGGKYGSRECDVTNIHVEPPWPILIESYQKFAKTLAASGSNPRAGAISHEWAVMAGFAKDKIVRSESWLCFSASGDPNTLHPTDVENLQTWSPDSPMGQALVKHGVATKEEVEVFRKEWERYNELKDPNKAWSIRCGEIICTK